MSLRFHTSMIHAATAFTAIFSAAGALGQEQPAMPEPSEHHAWLAKFEGKWETHSEATMAPGQPPSESKGTLSSRKLGGFWIQNELKGDWNGMQVIGVQMIGYDETKKKYVGTWVDSVSSFMWHYEGSVNESGTTLTLEADGPNFMADGKTTKFHDIYEFKSPKEILMTSKMLGTDGEWVTYMTGTAKKN